jgi:alkanesulfonate monooxygenase SsuD/methylene tetrahydromethanopterin reductase-like flavin-dependent oxidoreductase (luciferase family)
MSRRDTRMYNANKFKLGLFCFNCSNGLTMTKAPEHWNLSWDTNVAVARMGETAGLEFLVPLARWHGYRGETDTDGTSFETLTWASGLLALTEEITVFGTVHTPYVNPVFAAKQIVTADHIGKGRFGLNVVSGANAGEFRMFGVPMHEHDERYALSEEWLTIAKRLWRETEPFDFRGNHFTLEHVIGKPKLYDRDLIPIMSAGSSGAGRAFAARHADCLFMVIIDQATLAEEIAALRASAGMRDRVGVFASGHVFCKRTRKETEEYYRYIVHEMGDWEAVEHILSVRKDAHSFPKEKLRALSERMVSGTGTFPVIGDPDTVAATFKSLADAGLDGMAIGFVNYLGDFPLFRDEVLPRLERIGLREPGPSA